MRSLSDPSLATMDLVLHSLIAALPGDRRAAAMLAAMDWRDVSPDQVAHLLAQFTETGKPLPQPLAKAVLLGGHALPDPHVSSLPASWQLLSHLQGTGEGGELPMPVETITDPALLTALVNRLKGRGETEAALSLALAHAEAHPQALAGLSEALTAYQETLPQVTLHVLGFSTTYSVAQALGVAMAAHGFGARVTEGNFGEAIPELLRTQETTADAVFLILDWEGFFSMDWRQDATASEALFSERLESLLGALQAFAERRLCPLFVNSLPAPAHAVLGHLDAVHAQGAGQRIRRVNAALAELARDNDQLFLVDGDQAMAAIAPQARLDPKLWFYGRLPYGADASRALAHAFARAWAAFRRGPAKVLALDMDNTLWGGVYGGRRGGQTGLWG